MGVLHACVAAEPAVWRHRVGRIAGQEHTSILIALRVVGHRAPCRDIVDLHRHVRHTHGGAHQLDTARLGDVIGDPGRFRPRGVAHGVDREKARPAGFFQAEESAQHRIEHIDHSEVPAAQQRTRVSTKIDGDAVRDRPRPRMPIPNRSRMGLRLPSAAIM